MLPTILYKSPGPFVGPPVDGKSTTYDTLGVSDAGALDAALTAGWRATLPEALERTPVVVVEAPAPKPLSPTKLAPPKKAPPSGMG